MNGSGSEQEDRIDEWANQWVRHHWWLLTMVILASIAALILIGTNLYTHFKEGAPFHPGPKLALVVYGAVVGWFLDIFTGEATDQKLSQMVTFCYVFPFAILAGMLLPLFAFPVALPEPPKPIGIILGCSIRPDFPEDRNLVPDAIVCDNRADQWLVNIGGNAVEASGPEGQALLAAQRTRVTQMRGLATAPPGTSQPRDARGSSTPGAPTADVPQPSVQPASAAAAGASAPASAASAAAAPASAGASGVVAQAHGPASAAAGSASGRAGAAAAAASGAASAGAPRACDAGCKRDIATAPFVVTGGLVVPLYFVALSVFGGFVSMLRRVPEYQKRVGAGEAALIAPDRLANADAREKLVFQVLQMLAAPLIAVTAYYLIDPASRASSIALAFIAGFSSETVLLYVRALVEKLQPDTAGVTVTVFPSVLVFKRPDPATPAPSQTVTLTNRTTAAVQGQLTVTGEFKCTPNGPYVVAPGTSMSFAVAFEPTGAGARAGNLQFADNGPGSPRIVNLSGQS